MYAQRRQTPPLYTHHPTRDHPSRMKRSLLHLVTTGAIAGLLLGLTEAAETILDGFLAAYGLTTHITFAAACALLLAGTGAFIGLGLWALQRIVPRPIQDRSHLIWSILMAGQLAWIAFLYAFKLFPLLGIAILPSAGLFNPVLPGTVGLIALTLATFAAGLWLLFRYAHTQIKRQLITLAATLLLYWQVSYALYAMSRIAPANALHALSLALLFLLVISLLAHTQWTDTILVTEKTRKRTHLILITTLLVLAPATHHLIGTHGSHTLRLLLHERTALTYRTLQWLPKTYSTDVSSAAATTCDTPRDATRPEPPTPTKPARGVILIMVDALRADLIGATRNNTPLTPNLTALAEDSLSFERAYSTAAVTRESAASMLTGRHTTVADIGKASNQIPSIAHDLNQADVRTIAIPVHPLLNRAFADFDVLDDTISDRPDHRFARTSADTVDRTIHHLSELGDEERFFLFAHFYDPHWYYVPNDRFYFGPTERDRYHAEIAHTDHHIGRLLDRLAKSPHARNLAVIIVGDHGEEFWEHKYIQHVVRLYDESVRVPLIIHHPNTATPRRIKTPVSTTDVAPTILELLGLSSQADMTGRPLLQASRTGEFDEVPVYSTAPDKKAVVHGNHKLIVDTTTGVIELYDLDADPGEAENLADREAEKVGEMLCLLGGVVEGPTEFGDGPDAPSAKDAQTAAYEALWDALSKCQVLRWRDCHPVFSHTFARVKRFRYGTGPQNSQHNIEANCS